MAAFIFAQNSLDRVPAVDLDTMSESIIIDRASYEVEHWFSNARVIIAYQGGHVLADRRGDGGWDLSGEPARGEEKDVLAKLLGPTMDTTVVTVTPPQE